VDAVADGRFFRRASIKAIATLIAIILAAPPLAVSDQGFAGFLAGAKTGADIRVATDGPFIPHDFLDRLGTSASGTLPAFRSLSPAGCHVVAK